MANRIHSFDGQLLKCIKLGHNNKISSILQDKSLCNTIDCNKWTLLHYAAKYGNKSSAKQLIDLGAEVDAQSYEGTTPLIIAVKKNHEKVVDILVEAKADVFITDQNGECALEKGYRLLGISVNIKRALLYNITPESLSQSQFWKSEFFHILIPLYHFIPLKKVELTTFLLQHGSQIDACDSATGKTSLHFASEESDLKNVKLLVEYGANVNAVDYKGKTPMNYLKTYGNFLADALKIYKILTDAGAMLIDYKSFEMLVSAILFHGNKEIVRTMLHHIKMYLPDDISKIPVHDIIDNKNPGVLEVLENFGFDLKIYNRKCETLLHDAAGNSNLSAIKFFLKRGADVNVKNRHNETPLCMAIDHWSSRSDWITHYKCIEILLQSGADPKMLNFRELSNSKSCVELMKPVISHIAINEVFGQKIEESMQDEIERRSDFKFILDSSRQQLEIMKQIKIDTSVNLFDFIIAKNISQYASNKVLISNLNNAIKEYTHNNAYYHRRLLKRLRKLKQIATLNEIFVKYFCISGIDIAEKITDFLMYD